jgi:hypothetical protein
MSETIFPSMETDVWFCRVNDYILGYYVLPGARCPQCYSGECYSPMQTCAPPQILTCLGCGHTTDRAEFKA